MSLNLLFLFILHHALPDLQHSRQHQLQHRLKVVQQGLQGPQVDLLVDLLVGLQVDHCGLSLHRMRSTLFQI